MGPKITKTGWIVGHRVFATESQSFVETVKKQMQSIAIGRHVREKAEGFEFRESQSPYKGFFDTQKIDIQGKTSGFGMNKRDIGRLAWLDPQ